jgi:alkylation response protein AidB-like acyl-CoA dehydrogenase
VKDRHIVTNLHTDRAQLEESDVRALVDQFLAAHPPASMVAQAFWEAQFDAGLAWVDFPVGLGGLGADLSVAEKVDDLLLERGVPKPATLNLIGVEMMAPTVLAFGTPGQKATLLRPAFACTDIWCQLFSEPGAGSDLASLQSKAVPSGDHWIVNGQKVWTTLAHIADKAMCLVRTNPELPKHKGLTMFMLDMRSPGVDVRPLRQLSGEAEYNEVFLTDVAVSDEDRIGEVGQGWRVATALLSSERGVIRAMSRGSAMDVLQARLLSAWARADRSHRTAVWRDVVARLWGETTILRLNAQRADLPPSVGKVGYGMVAQRVAEVCVDLQGPAGGLIDTYAMTQPTSFTHMGGESDVELSPGKAFLVAQSLTIAGGTTNVNKNVLAERVLGLPAEPRSER